MCLIPQYLLDKYCLHFDFIGKNVVCILTLIRELQNEVGEIIGVLWWVKIVTLRKLHKKTYMVVPNLNVHVLASLHMGLHMKRSFLLGWAKNENTMSWQIIRANVAVLSLGRWCEVILPPPLVCTYVLLCLFKLCLFIHVQHKLTERT